MFLNAPKEVLDEFLSKLPDTHQPLQVLNFSRHPEPIEYERAYQLGMIRKENLHVGMYYHGACRNAEVARWDGEYFTYMRTKFGHSYKETIKYPIDELYYDVFIPMLPCMRPTENQLIKD